MATTTVNFFISRRSSKDSAPAHTVYTRNSRWVTNYQVRHPGQDVPGTSPEEGWRARRSRPYGNPPARNSNRRPIPDSTFQIPHSRFHIPHSIPHSTFQIPDSRFRLL